jgi:hypothetical protein
MDNSDREICDAVSDSYTTLGLNAKALIYIDSRIARMKTMSGNQDRTQNDYSNWDFYHGLKSAILYKEEKYLHLYKLILGYKKFGGNKDLYLVKLTYVESLYYSKYFKPLLYKFVYALSLIIPLMISVRILFNNQYTTSFFYYAIIGFLIAILVFYLYFKNTLRWAILKAFRLYISLFIRE